MPQTRLTTNGNVFRRTDGRWQSVIWYFDEQGVKRRKVFSSKTKTEAQQKITTYIAQFNAEVRNSDESHKTLKDSLTRWLQVFKFPSVERTTYDRLECTAQHQVFPLIGDKIVSDITAVDLKSVLNHWMDKGYAYTTVKKVHILLNEYFRYLTEEDFIQKNPMQSVPMMKRANFLAAQDKECVPEQEAVIAMTALIDGVKAQLVGQLGLNMSRTVNITCWPPGNQALDQDDIEEIGQALAGDYEFVTGFTYTSAQASSSTASIDYLNINGFNGNSLVNIVGLQAKYFLTE